MSEQRTLGIIEPDAVEAGRIGAIIDMIEHAGLRIAAMRLIHLSRGQAQEFYAVHKERPFYGELVDFMVRGPVVVMALEGKDAIKGWRTLMGATDPAGADPGTVRKLYGKTIGENAVHGSDSPDTARFEVGFFFPGYEVG